MKKSSSRCATELPGENVVGEYRGTGFILFAALPFVPCHSTPLVGPVPPVSAVVQAVGSMTKLGSMNFAVESPRCSSYGAKLKLEWAVSEGQVCNSLI